MKPGQALPGRTRGDISEVKINAQGEVWGRDRSNWVLWGALLYKPCVVQLNIVHPCTLRSHRASGAEPSALFHIYKIFSYSAAKSVGCSQSCWDPPFCHTCAIPLCLRPKCWGSVGTLPLCEASHKFLALRNNPYTELCWQCRVVSYFTSAVACAIYIVHVAATGGMMNGLCVPCFLLLLISDW